MSAKLVKILLVGVGLCMMSFVCPNEVDAQRGQKSIGLIGGYGSYNKSGYADLYFQYTFASHVRIAPELGYMFRNNDLSGFNFNIDMHFPFRISRGVNVYPLAGVAFNSWKYEPVDNSINKFGLNFGVGLELYFTSNLKLFVQGKYSLLDDTDGVFAGVGIGYVF